MRSSSSPLLSRAVFLSVCLTFFIVTLGAFVRLSDAGLGCPDWPGCYGHLGVPDEHHEITRANSAYPDRPVEAHKAWKEMIHRYFASSLGLLLVGIAIAACYRHRHDPGQQRLIPVLMVPLVMLQGAFGMWTVTLKVHPVFVTLHLVFGMTTLSLAWLMWLKQHFPKPEAARGACLLRKLAVIGLIVVIAQIVLGGWTSTNYAAVQCGKDFPSCQGELVPPMNLPEAFDLFLPIGPDYEGGHLDNTGLVTIHMVHRIGALLTFLMITLLCTQCLKHASSVINKIGIIIFSLLLLQLSLGISNVIFGLPLAVAVAHNGVAALLLLSVIALNFFLSGTSHATIPE